MAANYRAIVHYHFKEGMEEKGIQFLENELVKKGRELGCHYIELWQNEKDHKISLKEVMEKPLKRLPYYYLILQVIHKGKKKS